MGSNTKKNVKVIAQLQILSLRYPTPRKDQKKKKKPVLSFESEVSESGSGFRGCWSLFVIFVIYVCMSFVVYEFVM